MKFIFIAVLLGLFNFAAVVSAQNAASTSQSESLSRAADALKADPIAYLGSKIRFWTRDDAEDELGRPARRQDAVDIQTDDVIGDTLKFKGPLPQYNEIDLTFDHTSRKLSVVYLYPKGAVAASTLRDLLGKSFVKFTNPNGMPSYVYQFPQRTVSIQADVKDDVVNIMIW